MNFHVSLEKIPGLAHDEAVHTKSPQGTKNDTTRSIISRNKKRSTTTQKSPPIIGTITVHHKGFGFVTPEDTKEVTQDIFIPKPLIQGAVDGDKVECYVDYSSRSKKGPEGGVLSIVERGRCEIGAIVEGTLSEEYYRAFAPVLGAEKLVTIKADPSSPLEIGDRLLLKVCSWGEAKKPTVCEVKQKIGHISEPSCDVNAAAVEYSIRDEFPQKAIEEARAFGTKVNKAHLKDRLDLTQKEIFTIDPDTAKDFDDALSLEQKDNGHFLLGVHIADVSAYVQEDSILDMEARKRCNSTYFPGRCIPMLPHELSDNLCSLREKALRLTISVFMEFSESGELVNSSVHKSFIKSNKRFTYEDAYAVIQGKKRSRHAPTLQRMVHLCELLKNKRAERGSVDLALPETVILVDDDGVPLGIKTVDYDITHQLVEEFMLKSNEVVATVFIEHDLPSVFRIHEEPSEETMNEFYALARGLGFTLPSEPTVHDVQNLFQIAKNTPYAHRLAISFVRSMKLAIYSKENVGHYGLSLDNYCHFTSPIRRYSDLVIHRMLFSLTPPEDLKQITEECSEKERKSFKAEQSVLTLKKLRLLARYFNDDPNAVYKGYVGKVKPHGIFFEIEEIAYGGYIHISQLGDDYYEYSDERATLYGVHTGKEFAFGDHIMVRLTHIDLVRRETQWALEGGEKRSRKRRKKRRTKS